MSSNSLDIPLTPKTQQPKPFKPHYMAIPTFILYCVVNIQLGLSISSFTPLESTFTQFYEMNVSTVVYTTSLFLTGNSICVLIVYPINKHWGNTITIRIGLLANIIGAALKLLINYHFSFVLLGQFISGFAACCTYNTMMEFNYNWFRPQIRPIFNSILTFSVYIGGGLGNTIPLLFFDPSHIGSKDQAYSVIFGYVYKMFLIITGLSIFTIISYY